MVILSANPYELPGDRLLDLKVEKLILGGREYRPQHQSDSPNTGNNSAFEEVQRMIEISLLSGELLFAALWLLCRGILWLRQKKIVWKREAVLLLMFVNLAVLIRFVFYPFFTVNGHVRPLMINLSSIQPIRINLIPFVNILDYDNKR